MLFNRLGVKPPNAVALRPLAFIKEKEDSLNLNLQNNDCYQILVLLTTHQKVNNCFEPVVLLLDRKMLDKKWMNSL